MVRSCLLLLFLTANIYPWGMRGHRIVARIAEGYLTDTAREKINTLLKGESLAYVSNTPDHLRSNEKWQCADPLHYVSVSEGEAYQASTKNASGDIVQALIYFEDLLRSRSTSDLEKRNAVIWLTHLVGDMHQPLHVGRACDRGGNTVSVAWFGKNSNLHKVWDSELINHEELSFSEYAIDIDKSNEEERSRWAKSTYLNWIDDAHLRQEQIYTCFAQDGCCFDKKNGKCVLAKTVFSSCGKTTPSPIALKYAYVANNRNLLNLQLLKAGVRLAALFNRIFDGTPLAPSEIAMREKIKNESIRNKIGTCINNALR
ncbi:MAG: hypothetical protein LDLANPLL_01492 [Turneriella sp.]|nr:hypothetical protein [Turneriella sp.]